MNHQRSAARSFLFVRIPPPLPSPPLSVFIALSLLSRQLWGGVLLDPDHTAAGQTSVDSLPFTA